MRIIVLCCYLLLISALPAVSALAETSYVTDRVTITLRRGPGTEYKIMKSLSSGTALEVLEEVSEDAANYLKVRTKDGSEGYVLKQYVSTQLPKAFVIARLERERRQLQERLAGMAKGNEAWTAEKEALQRQLAEAQQAFDAEKRQRASLAKKHQSLLTGAKHVAELLQERDQLKAENEKQAGELAQLRKDNDAILRKAIVKWFLAGAGVLFVGWLMGKRSRPRKRAF